MKYFRCLMAFLAGLSLILPGVSASPLPSGNCVSDKYSVVLDSVFPVDWLQCQNSFRSFGGLQMTIRVLPGLSQESQIFICQVKPGQFFVVSSTLDPKDKSVWSHTQKLLPIDDRTSVQVEAPESSGQIAAAIHVIHKSCKLDSRIVDGWFHKLATVRMSLPRLGGGIDGTTYELTLEHGSDLMQAKIWADKQQKPLIALVDNIYREVERGNCAEIQRIPKKA